MKTMNNIEKVKRILDAGHWVKVTYPNSVTRIITSYYKCLFSLVHTDSEHMSVLNTPDFKDCTIEVIQRIPTPYVAWDKVLVLSNPTSNSSIGAMVWKVCEIRKTEGLYRYAVWDELKYSTFLFPSHCLSPAFEEDSLSGKEAKIVIDGKEYSVTLKLI